MTKLLSFVFALISVTFISNAQVLFEEDFQGGSFVGFTLTDVDGLPVHSNVSQFNDSWIVAPNDLDSADFTAQSTSSYNPAGTSDDWMSTPSIALGTSGNLLSWEGRCYFANGDGYEVWVNTSGATPTEMLAGTMVFNIASEENVNTLRAANLDAFANQTVFIGFRNNSTDEHILLIDDIKVEVAPNVDAELLAITNTSYAPAAPTNVNFDIKNTGIAPIIEFTAEWTDGTNTYQQTFPANISPLNSASFTFSDQLVVSPGIVHSITVNITSVNGAGPDGNQSNDSASKTVSGMTFIPKKLVVGEEATGMWCGWCPRGWDFMDYMFVNYLDNWVGIAVHNNDLLTDTDYDAGMVASIGGYPSGHVDRAILDVDPAGFETAYLDRVTHIPPAGVSVTSSQVGNTIELSVTAKFAATLSVDYRLNCVAIENEIQDNAYDQVNYYNWGMEPLIGYGLAWSSLSNPVPGADLTYMRVARSILGGWDGQSGSVPNSVTSGQQVTYTWTYPIPAGSDVNNMEFIGMLIDQTTGEILNAGRNNITNDLGIPSEEINNNLQIYPNPFTSFTVVSLDLLEASEVTIEIRNMTGKTVQTIDLGTCNEHVSLELNAERLESGIYFVDVFVNERKTTKKVSVLK